MYQRNLICHSSVHFLMENIRAYGGCLGFERRRRTWLGCAKRREGAEQPVIRRYPNEETHFAEMQSTWLFKQSQERTLGSETSQYQEEKKKMKYIYHPQTVTHP